VNTMSPTQQHINTVTNTVTNTVINTLQHNTSTQHINTISSAHLFHISTIINTQRIDTSRHRHISCTSTRPVDCVDVLMCWCVDDSVDVSMCWCVEGVGVLIVLVWMCWCVDVWCVCWWVYALNFLRLNKQTVPSIGSHAKLLESSQG
jgi:hypothetical protein